VFTRVRHWSLSWAKRIHSMPTHPISLKSIFHENPVCIPLSSRACYMPYPFHTPWLDYSNYIWRRVMHLKRNRNWTESRLFRGKKKVSLVPGRQNEDSHLLFLLVRDDGSMWCKALRFPGFRIVFIGI
jgi:hypothetical protein